jgi:hypothetical protein
MSTPVSTTKWAGQFDCTGGCRRKRLMAEEFSKKSCENFKKHNKPMKCKLCTEAASKAEQEAAASSSKIASSSDAAESVICSACTQSLPTDSFNKTQLRKPDDKRRCRECVVKAEENEKTTNAANKSAKLAAAEERVAKANASGTPAEQLKATAELSALQAETVTGLKPIVLGAPKGRPGGGHKR